MSGVAQWLGKDHSKRRAQVQFWVGNFCFLIRKTLSLPVEKCLKNGIACLRKGKLPRLQLNAPTQTSCQKESLIDRISEYFPILTELTSLHKSQHSSYCYYSNISHKKKDAPTYVTATKFMKFTVHQCMDTTDSCQTVRT